jgi:hypothetical protein
MTAIVEPLILDLVEWVAKEPRPYSDVMEAWRTSCPRLMVWEEAVDRGLVRRETRPSQGLCVVVTAEGLVALAAAGRNGEACSRRPPGEAAAKQRAPAAACAR